MSVTHDEILLAAVPGEEYTPPSGSHVTGSSIERPRKYWRSHDQNWAVYTVAGNRLGETIIESVKKARGKGLVPLLVVRDNTELAAVAERYGDIECHVACPIGGCGSLIPPLSIPHKRTRKEKCSSRIPQDLLGELAGSALFPGPIRSILRHLLKAYEQMPRTGTHDTAEHSALAGFMKGMLHQIGVPTEGKNTIDMIRHLEIAGWGGSRDHFFHSFQNFFFGLYAVARLSPHFTGYRAAARLDWDLDSYHVWFLTALWHDVGYGISHLEDIHEEVLGSGLADTTAESSRAEFLNDSLVQEGLLKICALMARLLRPDVARTGYMAPDQWPKRSRTVGAIRKAFEESVMDHGHGAPSALRLYSDFMPAARRLAPPRQDILTQVVQLACASLPLHDVNFRDHLRESLGRFVLDTTVMPFAALLAFVDSIQDDRRDLNDLKEEVRFLERILVQDPATVMAEVNGRSLPVQSILWKVVEARDVLSHLSQNPASLYFRYPAWMVPI
jgi:hypothetical protein